MARLLKRNSGPKGNKSSDQWRTNRALYSALHDEFSFGFDLAADKDNALCEYFFSLEQSGWDYTGHFTKLLKPDDRLSMVKLAELYGVNRTGFCNPPYSDIAPFLTVAISEAIQGFTSVHLIPYTPDTRWWNLVLLSAEVRRIPHRVKFDMPPGSVDKHGKPVKYTTPMFPSCVVVYRPRPGVLGNPGPRYVDWDSL
jgi:hypothetical protein